MHSRFNPRPHAAGDDKIARSAWAPTMFQSTPARGGRHRVGRHRRWVVTMFQSTPARGGRHDCWRSWPRSPIVSIHARTRRATSRPSAGAASTWHVSIHARTRRATTIGRPPVIGPEVSIHARTRRATAERRLPIGDPVIVSIHARTRRATTAGRMSYHRLRRFNPRPHAAGDETSLAVWPHHDRFQSTPARGGRPRVRRYVRAAACSFNPRPHAAGDGCERDRSRHVGNCFNPRPHAAGDRPANANLRDVDRCFNPRPHAAGDHKCACRCSFDDCVSIHARTRRATGTSVLMDCRPIVSIHARTRRATPAARHVAARCRRFNPRPHAAGDAVSVDSLASRMCFNPRPHAAGDRLPMARPPNSLLFQSTPARGGRRVAGAGSERTAISFNPRPHAAGDLRQRTASTAALQVSIHARTRRATRSFAEPR